LKIFTYHLVTDSTPLAFIENANSIASIEKYTECKQTEPEVQCKTAFTKSKTELDKFAVQYGFKLNASLTIEQKYEMLQLLYDYRDVFARDLSEIKQCTAPPISLPVMPPYRAFKRQFKLNEEESQEVNRQIETMHQHGIIEKTTDTTRNSPIFTVKKKDGSRRLVIDLRGVNSLIAPQYVQLPLIDDILDQITQNKPNLISSIDIRAAYWHLKLHEDSRKFTAFTSPKGVRYHFKVIPFGLNLAPNYLNLNLAALYQDKERFPYLAVYMDDLVLYSNTFNDHKKQLREVLDILRQNGFSANPTKTEIAFQEVDYLGFKVSASGVRMAESRIEALQHLQAPKNVRGVQRLIGLCNFWRRYIKDYAQKTYHIRQLLRKMSHFGGQTLVTPS